MILILMVLAIVCLLLQALEINVKRIAIGWLGLFFWALAVTIPLVPHMGSLELVAVILIVVILVVFLPRRTAL